MGNAKRRAVSITALGAMTLALSGCGGDQNSLDPASHAERSIGGLFWVMFIASWVGFGVVVFLLFLGWWRRRRPDLPGGVGERGATALVIGLGVALPIVLLSALFVWSDFFVTRATSAPSKGSTAMTIDVVGHEWWWEARYEGTTVDTANEIHIPTNTRVAVVVATADVIHSFWIPQLNRKMDTIPGQQNTLLLDAERPGVYRGQCSEFCGLQHAHMAVDVVAESPAAFRSWLAAQERPAATPASGEAAQGAHVFMTSACAGCHQIRGTSAHGLVGPDLTHLESRATLAALTIPNTPGNLAFWIRHPQNVKPGNKMPDLQLSDSDWHALNAYLGTLH